MIHHDVKIDTLRYSTGQRDELTSFERKMLVQVAGDLIKIGSDSDGIAFSLQDFHGALKILGVDPYS